MSLYKTYMLVISILLILSPAIVQVNAMPSEIRKGSYFVYEHSDDSNWSVVATTSLYKYVIIETVRYEIVDITKENVSIRMSVEGRYELSHRTSLLQAWFTFDSDTWSTEETFWFNPNNNFIRLWIQTEAVNSKEIHFSEGSGRVYGSRLLLGFFGWIFDCYELRIQRSRLMGSPKHAGGINTFWASTENLMYEKVTGIFLKSETRYSTPASSEIGARVGSGVEEWVLKNTNVNFPLWTYIAPIMTYLILVIVVVSFAIILLIRRRH